MSFVPGAGRRLWRRLTSTYRLMCARDDAASRGLTVPTGVWVCEKCQQVLLELTLFAEHVTTAHAGA